MKNPFEVPRSTLQCKLNTWKLTHRNQASEDCDVMESRHLCVVVCALMNIIIRVNSLYVIRKLVFCTEKEK